MKNIFWIPTESIGKLAIVTRPRPGDWLEDEIRKFKKSSIDVLVSALTPEENEELGLIDESVCCTSEGIEFISFPITDRSVPFSRIALDDLARRIKIALEDGRSVGIHCRASIGRASIIAASVLVHLGIPAESAFSRITEARGCAVPDTPEQRAWVQANALQSFKT